MEREGELGEDDRKRKQPVFIRGFEYCKSKETKEMEMEEEKDEKRQEVKEEGEQEEERRKRRRRRRRRMQRLKAILCDARLAGGTAFVV
ncbi:hypothetical protein E2C01_099153 [Portunus trituberculatus]|uniref:Uncharacterized protein n=1 Tax=Portunus trituberculatus TaxID=210409 RepID=A0A5B7JZK3_PORTR|nr:hypothetical protein [Portunus trituberculatus]